ncbi:MAG TPA: Ig-like domain-containing protein, partial [Thermoanaerobaculia bacterium]|nr:Ig-like domain-containing protein [Thermoanaerobaculia bacterium]
MLRLRFCALALASVVSASSTFAATQTDFRVLIDSDLNATSGCTVAGFGGVEHVLNTRVEDEGTSARVSSITTAQCNASTQTLGPALALLSGTYAAGVDSATRTLLIETSIPLSSFGGTLPSQIRLGFVGSFGGTSSTIVTTPAGAPLTFPVPGARIRPVRVLPPRFRTIILDGNGGDWEGISPLPVAPPATGNQAIRFVRAYAYLGATDLFFRIDAVVDGSSIITANDSYTVRQGRSVSIAAPGVLANDSNPAGGALSAALEQNTLHGTLLLFPDGGFSYVHHGSLAPTDSFRYKATSGGTESAPATVTLTVTPNTPPVATDDSYSVLQRGTLNVPARGILTNDRDADGDPIIPTIDTQPLYGNVSLRADGSFTYVHTGSTAANDSFRYHVFDGVSSSNIATVRITIIPNNPPVAQNDAFTVAEGGTLSVPAPGLFANDSDLDTPQAQWTASVVTGPTNGTLTVGTGGAFTYVHNGSETSSDTFSYRISDGTNLSGEATVTITLTAVNDPPVATGDSYTTSEDTPLTVPAPGVLSNDTDADSGSRTASLVTQATQGTVVLNANGSFTYTPNANANGTDSFVYAASDGTSSSQATVTLTITAVNDSPSFTGTGNVTVNEDSGAYSQSWTSSISGGPADEPQSVTFALTNDNNALFTSQPAMSAAGV